MRVEEPWHSSAEYPTAKRTRRSERLPAGAGPIGDLFLEDQGNCSWGLEISKLCEDDRDDH
jgi:hypothetical protein